MAAGLPLTQIGDFDCVLKPGEMATPGKVSSMTDSAIDENLAIWSVSSFAVHPITVTGSKVHCGTPIPLTYPILMDKNKRFYSLSFAPTGVLDPAKEVLVAGNTAGELWAIDPNGKITQHGTLGNIPATDGHGHAYANYDPNTPKAWEISGDIVFLSNNGKPVGFATVRDCPNPPSPTGCSGVDSLIEIDMSKMAMAGAQSVQKSLRGQVVKRVGCNDSVNAAYGYLYGIATWNDKVYGFGHEGNLVDISLLDGSACLVKNYAASMFSGAAVTTVAPVTPPPSSLIPRAIAPARRPDCTGTSFDPASSENTLPRQLTRRLRQPRPQQRKITAARSGSSAASSRGRFTRRSVKHSSAPAICSASAQPQIFAAERRRREDAHQRGDEQRRQQRLDGEAQRREGAPHLRPARVALDGAEQRGVAVVVLDRFEAHLDAVAERVEALRQRVVLGEHVGDALPAAHALEIGAAHGHRFPTVAGRSEKHVRGDDRRRDVGAELRVLQRGAEGALAACRR